MTSNTSICDSFEALLESLPKESFWDSIEIYQWKGYWFHPSILQVAIDLPSNFEPRDDDVILASSLKVGTTWLKALSLSIMNNSPNNNNVAEGDEEAEDILTKGSPHLHIPTIESMICVNNTFSIISGMPSPRLLHTHLPYSLLPDSVKSSACKIVYMTRNPKDTLISLWHHLNKTSVDEFGKEKLVTFGITSQVSLEKAFESFCSGKYLHGPFFDHVLEYYKESLNMPNKILFLKFEEMKSDPKRQVKKLASFLGRPFSKEEEEEVEKVLWRCSLERLKNLEVNKNGVNPWNMLPNSIYFRRGVTGDSKNYLTPEMEERLDHITRTNLEGSGLVLDA